MIISEKELKKKKFVAINTFNCSIGWKIYKGAKLKVLKFNGTIIRFKLSPKDVTIDLSLDEYYKVRVKECNSNLKKLKSGLKVWDSEPEKMVYEDRKGFGPKW